MRMMMRVSMPVESGNAAIKAGKMPQIVAEAMARMKPEAAYFTADQARRTVYFFVDLKDAADMPTYAEPFFLELNAAVDFQPVMNAEDLKRGLSQLSK
jgi:hypothetical protein